MTSILQTLSAAFSSVLNMSVTASVVIVFVLAVRLLLRRAPKVFSYALWAVVLFRLLCPVSFTADFSLLGLVDAPAAEVSPNTTVVEYIPPAALPGDQTVFFPVTPGGNITPNVTPGTTLAPVTPPAVTPAPAETALSPADVLPLLWAAGILAMVVYSVVSLLRLRRSLRESVPLRDNIRLADRIGSPFVMGLLRPKIYLPSSLPEQERSYILLHEQYHIRRLDHIVKALAFIALCIHWFNPLVWLAFILSSKDMEMSCDEAVVRQLGEDIRADYSASLLSLATGRRIIAGTPLAFGEGDTGSRIKNMLHWKKPALWVIIAAAVVCVAVVLVAAGNPADTSGDDPDDPAGTGETPSIVQGEYGSPEDLSYYLELAAGGEFRDMDENRKADLLAEYRDLLDDYTLIARETADGKSAYIVGRYNGDPADSPLYGMYSAELNGSNYLLYREEDSIAVENALLGGGVPDAGFLLTASRSSHFLDSGLIFIQPLESELAFDVPVNRYLHTPNSREYIADAVSRGVDLLGRTDTYLYVYLIHEQFGEISERFALTEEEAADIAAEELTTITDGFGFSASLHIGDETTYYTERTGIPQTVLDLAVEKCDYRFGDPGMITDTIREARLDCDWLDAPLYADAADLPRLREMLKNAEFGYVGACGYGAKLTLTFTGGEKLTVFKGTDGCDSIVFGSYSGYFIGDEENTAFWKMFGLDPDTKERIEPQAVSSAAFSRQGLRLEVSGVLSSRTETMLLDDGSTRHEYTVFTCLPGAEITVNDPGMSDGALFEDGLPHANWGLSYTGESDRTRITASTVTVPVTADLEGVYNLEASLFVLKFELVEPSDDAEVELFSNGEVSIHIPVKYAHLVQMDDLYSDNMYTVAANLYYKPEYIVSDAYAPGANGGWMLTLHTTFPDAAVSTVWDSPAYLCTSTRWTADRERVYQELRPGEGFYLCSDANLAQFKAVMESIRIDYGDLVPFEVSDDPLPPEPPTASKPDAPPADADIRAALIANHAAVETFHMGTAEAANPFRTEAWLVLAEKSADTTHTFYLLTCHAVYDLLGSGTSTKYEAVAHCCHAAMLTFLWKDGGWQVSEYWLPGDGAYYEADIHAVFPADAAEKILGDPAFLYKNDVTGLCDDAAVRYYAQLTGWVPARMFYPADVEFTGQALHASVDTMTYEERLAWAQAGTDNGNVWPACTGQYSEGEDCIAYVEMIVAGRYPDLSLRIRFADGTTAGLPLPNAGGYDTALPETMEFRDGVFVYEVFFEREELFSEGQTLIHLQGTYHYEVDLTQKTVSLTVLPLE